MQYTVKKTDHNNILRVVDPTGCELIVTGRVWALALSRAIKLRLKLWSAATA